MSPIAVTDRARRPSLSYPKFYFSTSPLDLLKLSSPYHAQPKEHSNPYLKMRLCLEGKVICGPLHSTTPLPLHSPASCARLLGPVATVAIQFRARNERRTPALKERSDARTSCAPCKQTPSPRAHATRHRTYTVHATTSIDWHVGADRASPARTARPRPARPHKGDQVWRGSARSRKASARRKRS